MAWQIDSGLGENTTAIAFPFDQGIRDGKPEWRGQHALDLFSSTDVAVTGGIAPDPNLPEAEWWALLDWLRGRPLVFHNATYDLKMLKAGTRHWAGQDFITQLVWDTQIAERELAPAPDSAVSLSASTARNLIKHAGRSKASEAEAVKTWLRHQRLPAGRLDLVPWEIIESYAAGDAGLTIRLAAKQQRQIDERAELRLDQDPIGPRIQVQLQRQRALLRVENRGLPYDAAGSLQAAAGLLQWREQLTKRLPFRPTDPAAKAYWFGPTSAGGQNLQPYGVTAGGKPQLDKAIVAKMVEAGVKHADTWRDLSQVDTALSMWYQGYPNACGPDGRIRQVYKLTVVVSGRTSVERVNLQAIPHDYRLAGLPEGTPPVRRFIRLPQDSDDELWELDLATAELRAAARAARCTRMIEMIEAGQDLHGYIVRELFGLTPDDPQWHEYRQVGKRSNFSLIFDVGAKTFAETLAKQLNIYWEVSRCAGIIYDWHRLFNWSFKQAVHRAMQQVERRRWIRLSNGRIRRFSDHEVQYDSHKGFNAYIQGSLAEMALDWVVEADRMYPGVVINFVHDSLMLQIPKGEVGVRIRGELAAVGKRLFEQHFDIVGGVDAKPWAA